MKAVTNEQFERFAKQISLANKIKKLQNENASLNKIKKIVDEHIKEYNEKIKKIKWYI